jgi:hypothetical protein
LVEGVGFGRDLGLWVLLQFVVPLRICFLRVEKREIFGSVWFVFQILFGVSKVEDTWDLEEC